MDAEMLNRRQQAWNQLVRDLNDLRSATYDQRLWFNNQHRLWTAEHCVMEEVDHGGSFVEVMARKSDGDLLPPSVAVGTLLKWAMEAGSQDQTLLRFIHVGRYHDTSDGSTIGVVARQRPRSESLHPRGTILGFSRDELVASASACPLCNAT